VQARDRRVLLGLCVVVFQIRVRVVRGIAAGGQQRERETQPADGLPVPRAIAGDRCNRRTDNAVSGGHTKHQFDRPGQQIEVVLTAHLTPHYENCDQSDQKLS